jgi:hypothetical protein
MLILSQQLFLSLMGLPTAGDTRWRVWAPGGSSCGFCKGPMGGGGLPWQHHRPCPRGHWVPGRGPAKGGSPTLPLLLFLPFPCLPNIDLVPPVSQAQYLVMNTGHRPLLTGSLDRVGERQISKMTSERMSAVNKTKTMKCLSEVVLLGCKGLRHN